MKKHIFVRLIIAVLIMILAAPVSFAGTGSESKTSDQDARNAAVKLQKELKAQKPQKDEEARPKKAWENAQSNLDAQEAKVAAAQKAYDDIVAKRNMGSLGFFDYVGNKTAADTIRDRVATQDNDNWGNTNVGAEGDATSLTNFKKAVEWLKEANRLRTTDDLHPGLSPLLVTDTMMARSQVNTNASAYTVAHSGICPGGENLSWGSSNPFKGWYDKEKQNYINGSGTTGHYENIVDEDYVGTGFAINTTKNALYSIVHGETFSMYPPSTDTKYTVDDYETRVNEYCTAVEQQLKAAQGALNAAKAYQDELIANGGISNTEKKAIENTRTKASEDCIRLVHPAAGDTCFCGDTLEAEYEVYDTWEYYYTSATVAVFDNKGQLITALSGDLAGINRWTSQKGQIKLDPSKYTPGTYELWILNVPCYSDGTAVDGWESWDNVPYASTSFTVECKHQWKKEYTEDKTATCTEDGSESIHCSICNAIKENSSRVIQKHHTYGNWKTTKAATCTAKGSKEKICANCGDKVTEEISAKGHKWNEAYTTDKAATCTEEGSESIHCSVCNAIKENASRPIQKKSHAYGNWKTTKAATCTAQGSNEKVCTNCGNKVTEEIAAKGHTWKDSYTIDKKATYAAKGSKSIHCSKCNAVKPNSAVAIPKLTVKPTKLLKVTATSKGFTVKWNKGSGITGYQVQYALNKKFTSGKKTVNVTKASTVSKKFTKLKAKKKYYVKVRTYKTYKGKKYYSKWSEVKAVTTKN